MTDKEHTFVIAVLIKNKWIIQSEDDRPVVGDLDSTMHRVANLIESGAPMSRIMVLEHHHVEVNVSFTIKGISPNRTDRPQKTRPNRRRSCSLKTKEARKQQIKKIIEQDPGVTLRDISRRSLLCRNTVMKYITMLTESNDIEVSHKTDKLANAYRIVPADEQSKAKSGKSEEASGYPDDNTILDAMGSSDPWLSLSEIAETSGLTLKQVRPSMDRLIETGRIIHEKQGKTMLYSLASDK